MLNYGEKEGNVCADTIGTNTSTDENTDADIDHTNISTDDSDDGSDNSKLFHLGEVMRSADSSGINGWEKCWEEGMTPWDLGEVTPIVAHLVQSESLPKGRVLVPGCGAGYDVVALASPDRYVVGLDMSEIGTRKAKERSCSSPNKEYFSFLIGDFFHWKSEEQFDLVFDYTFFIAIDPSLRSSWANKINELLKSDGELITLIFVVTGQKDGPPHNNDLPDYEEVLNPLGFKAISIEENQLSVEQRKGSEKLVRWKKSATD